MRNRIGATIRRWADRIDPDGAPKSIGWSFTFEKGKGLVWRETRNQGCPVWVLSDRDYDRAHDEADSAPEEKAQERRRALLHTAMTEPDPTVAGAAAAELRAAYQQ